MAGIEAFIKGFETQKDDVKVHISDRFPDFTLRAVSAKEDKELRNEATERIKIKSNKFEEKLNRDAYLDKLIIATVVEPNFKDAHLQDALGVMGAEGVLNKLEAGEYITLLQAVTEVNGFDLSQEEKDEDLKN